MDEYVCLYILLLLSSLLCVLCMNIEYVYIMLLLNVI